ncbi:MAG: sulfate permease [Bacteroidota bacterium]
MLKQYLPILQWLSTYHSSYFKGDLAAGFTVGVMLVPQAMAYALIAGLPPVYGLYAALVPNLLYGLFGSSRKLAVGPVALDSLIVASGLASLKLATTEQYIEMAIFLALFVGTLQLLMGFAKMGFLANYLSRPVVSGFTSAAAIVISVSQLKYLIGIPIESGSGTLKTLSQLFQNLGQTNLFDLGIGLTAILIIVLLKKRSRKLPGAVFVVTLSILGVYFFEEYHSSLSLVGIIPGGLPSFHLALPELNQWGSVFPLALALAFIAFAEAMTMVKALEDKAQTRYTQPNQELRALGISNIIGSLFQAYPTNASFSRSAIMVDEGARSGLASIISALVVGATLLFFTDFFQYLPNAVLGAIILVAVYGLIDFKYPIELWQKQRDEFGVLVLTFLTTLLIGISEGIIFGVLFSLLLLVYRTSKPHVAVLGKIKGTNYFKNVSRFSEDIQVDDDMLIVRFDGQLYFANMDYFKKTLYANVSKKGDALKSIVLNAESINYMDSSATTMLHQIISDLKEKGIDIYIAGAIGPVRDILHVSGLNEAIGEDNFFVRTNEAVDFCLNKGPRTQIQKKISGQSRKFSAKG